MRIDRLISLRTPTVRKVGVGAHTTILMYHGICDRPEPGRHPYFKTVTSTTRFAEQMEWLAESGAEVVPLEAWNSPTLETALPEVDGLTKRSGPKVILTFDDGFQDFDTGAFPILRSHRFPATVFLPTAYIGTGLELLPGVKHLDWNSVEKLAGAGIRFGSHTATHRPMATLTSREIMVELRTSAADISKHIETKVTEFSCPFAFPQADRATLQAITSALTTCGYTVAVTTKIGRVNPSDDALSLRRIPVNGEDDRKLFLAKLAGGYDWLGGVQRWTRSAKRLLAS